MEGGDNLSFDYNKLRGEIRAKYKTQKCFAKEIGISATSLSDKLNEKSDFSHSEIITSCYKLNIALDDIPAYFFTEKVK